MQAEATIQRQGNAIGVALPPSILRQMGFAVGQTVTLQATSEGLLIKATRTRFTAAELNAQCDPDAPMPDDLQAWENMPPAGTER